MKVSKKYYKDVRMIFPFHGKREKIFLNSLLIQINEYNEDNPDCTYKHLEDAFGTPIEILKSYYDSIDSQYLLKKMENKQMINTLIISLFIVLFVIVLSYIRYGTI